jgi:hypothetical protein
LAANGRQLEQGYNFLNDEERRGSAVKRLSLWVLAVACLGLCGCPPDTQNRKPDPTRGTVTGLVICTDTGRPARFAAVQLLPVFDPNAPGSNGAAVDLDENGSTGIDGRFKIEAVPPGEYYAFAMLDGYIDPTLAIDENRVGSDASDRAKLGDEIEQWKDHLVKLSVAAQHTSDISLTMDRGAEIDGTVRYDDGSPAIGVHFDLLRRTVHDRWIKVGSGNDDNSLDAKSDGRGRYSIGNLPEGEYRICALLPDTGEDASPRFWYGGGFRINKAETVKVAAGEDHAGIDMVLPLDGLFTVSGSVTACVDGHAPTQATVHLLYQDDRAEARRSSVAKDGTFSFTYVPAGAYILQITGAQDAVPPASTQNSASATGDTATQTQAPPAIVHYMDKEMPLTVQEDMDDIAILLSAVPLPPPVATQ